MIETTINFENIQLEKSGKDTVMVEIIGQIDEANVDKIAEQFYQEIDNAQDQINFIVNLKELEFINSKGIGYFLDFYRKISEKNGKLALASLPENILDILNVVGVSKVLKTYSTIEEAKQALEN